MAKLEGDLKALTSHDSLMAHLVDELLLFEKELRLAVSEPNLTLLSVLLNSVPFDKWRNLEKARMYMYVYVHACNKNTCDTPGDQHTW